MIRSSAREQSLPLATEGYVIGVRERYIQVQRLVGGELNPKIDLSVSAGTRRVISVEHIAPRLHIKSIGGMNSSIRSQGVALSLSQKKISLGAFTQGINLTLSKN